MLMDVMPDRAEAKAQPAGAKPRHAASVASSTCAEHHNMCIREGLQCSWSTSSSWWVQNFTLRSGACGCTPQPQVRALDRQT